MVAGYVGTEAAADWVTSRFWFAIFWVLGVPVGFSLGMWAELCGGPPLVWPLAGAAWGAALAAAVRSNIAARTADRTASAALKELRGYPVRFSCPVWPGQAAWARALANADRQHEAHVRLAKEVGVAPAIEHLVHQKRAAQRLARIALRLAGFLLGFVLAVLGAFLTGQTKSGGVLAVFAVAVLVSILAPIPFRQRFDAVVETFRCEVTQELAAG